MFCVPSSEMLLFFVLSVFATCIKADDTDSYAMTPAASNLPRLSDMSAAEAFIESAEVVVVGFFESDEGSGYAEFLAAVEELKTLPAALCGVKEVWAKFNIDSDTISIFRKADSQQKDLNIKIAEKLDTDAVVRFFAINDIRYLTEYNPVSAVGLFQSEVKVHLILFINKGSDDYSHLKGRLEGLAPKYTGKMLFVLINGKDKANTRALGYFHLKSDDLPRIGLYDADTDGTWLMSPGEITSEGVQDFCDSFLNGELQKKEADEPEAKTEL